MSWKCESNRVVHCSHSWSCSASGRENINQINYMSDFSPWKMHAATIRTWGRRFDVWVDAEKQQTISGLLSLKSKCEHHPLCGCKDNLHKQNNQLCATCLNYNITIKKKSCWVIVSAATRLFFFYQMGSDVCRSVCWDQIIQWYKEKSRIPLGANHWIIFKVWTLDVRNDTNISFEELQPTLGIWVSLSRARCTLL